MAIDPSKPLNIACIGEAMVELSMQGDMAKVGFAGDTLNTAIYLKRNCALSHQISYVTCVGTDPLSARMLEFIQSENLGAAHITRHDTRVPGLYAIHNSPDGERSFTYWRENSAARTLFDDGFTRLEGFDMLYLSAITLAILPANIRLGLLEWLGSFAGTLVFDSNYRPNLWTSQREAQDAVSAAWRVCDIALPSLDDEMALFGDMDEAAVLARLRGYGVQRGALKRGDRGPVPIAANAPCDTRYPAATQVIDTTAAGDSFNGAFLAQIADGHTQQDAMLAGHVCASKVIAHHGAILPR